MPFPRCRRGRACWIVAFLVRQRSSRDDNQTVARVRMPAGTSYRVTRLRGLPDIALDVKVGRSFGLLQGQPNLPVVLTHVWQDEVVKDLEFSKCALGQRRCYKSHLMVSPRFFLRKGWRTPSRRQTARTADFVS
jgi:hypothetical protein